MIVKDEKVGKNFVCNTHQNHTFSPQCNNFNNSQVWILLEIKKKKKKKTAELLLG